MYSLTLIGLISKFQNTLCLDYRYQTRMWNCKEINFVSKRYLCFAWLNTWNYPDNYIQKFCEVTWKLKLSRDDFYSINSYTNLFLFSSPCKKKVISKKNVLFFYKLIPTVIHWKLCIARTGFYYQAILKRCNCSCVKLSIFVMSLFIFRS